MQILAIGQPYDPSIKEWPEGCHYNYDTSGHSLHYLYNHPSELERSSIQSGEAVFGFYLHGPVLFLLHRFGEMLWHDAPYSWWLVSEERRRIPEVIDGLHALLKVVLGDTATGLVEALRALTFSAEFTQLLHDKSGDIIPVSFVEVLGAFSYHCFMARISRIVVPGYPHHVTQRGVRSMAVFHSEKDRWASLIRAPYPRKLVQHEQFHDSSHS